MVQAPETNHIYTISNTVLVNYTANQVISLLWWSNDSGSKIGEPSTLTGLIQPGNVPVQKATESMVITRIT